MSADRLYEAVIGIARKRHYILSSFSETVAEKTAEACSNEVRKKTSAVLESIGSQASDEVKNAWMEAEEETGAFFTVFGLYISSDGKHAHMTQMGIDRFVRWYRGEMNPDDLLGSSVESAIKAVNKWIYDLDHPLAGQTARSMEERQLIMKEREFYMEDMLLIANNAGSINRMFQYWSAMF